MRTFIITCAMAFLGISHGNEAPTPPAVDLSTMTQDTRCRQILVTCLVNSQPMRMMLDTGATHTVLHKESAEKLKHAKWLDTSRIRFVGNAEQKPQILMGSLVAGSANASNFPFMVMDLSATRSMMAEKMDGILGMDVLGQLPFTFDLRNNSCYWGIPANSGALVPLYAKPDGTGRVIVQGKCAGKEVEMLLDTGSSITRVAAEQWAPGAAAEVRAQMGDINRTASIQVTEGKPGDMEIGPGVVVKNLAPILCEKGGLTIMGMDALQGQVLVHIPAEDSPSGHFLLLK